MNPPKPLPELFAENCSMIELDNMLEVAVGFSQEETEFVIRAAIELKNKKGIKDVPASLRNQ